MEKYLRGQSQELTGGQKQKPENNELQKHTEETNLGHTGVARRPGRLSWLWTF